MLTSLSIRSLLSIATFLSAVGIGAIAPRAIAQTTEGSIAESIPELAESIAELSQIQSEAIAFPQDAAIVDVTQAPYNAVGDGITDDTAAIQRALDAYPNGNKIIYLPEGTYLISDRLTWPEGRPGATDYKRTILQGASTNGTVIKLQDDAPAYQDSDNPQSLIYTGPAPAQRFRNGIRNLSIDTGNGNPGAIAIQFNASNQGTVRDVKIRSGDGSGLYGLDFGFTDEIGPLLVKNVEIEGFDVGIRTGFTVNSITFENILLTDQNQYGLVNGSQVMTIRGLTSRNRVPAVYNASDNGAITLVDALFLGSDEGQIAIKNEGTLFARNVTTSGYGGIIENDGVLAVEPGLSAIDEWVSQEVLSLFPSPPRSLNLPIRETPELPWENPDSWVNVMDFGAFADGKHDDTAAIQAAIDSGAQTLFFPSQGTFTVNGTVRVGGNVRRLIGTEGRVNGNGYFEIVDGSSDVVEIERFASLARGIVHTSSRTLVVRHSILESYQSALEGAGDVFIEDVAASPWSFNGQNVWARQLNVESDETAKITNNGGNLWILGLKTERGNVAIDTVNEGRTELLGAHIYSTADFPSELMFRSVDSWVSFAGVRETNFNGNFFRTVVEETRDGTTRSLAAQEAPGGINGSLLPLYVGYPSEAIARQSQSVPEPRAIVALSGIGALLASRRRRKPQD
jgi:hypothetical protein